MSRILLKWIALFLVLAGFLSANVAFKARAYPEKPLYVSDSAMRYRYANMVSRGEQIPEVDKKLQAPEGLKVRSLLFLFQDKTIGLTYRIFSAFNPRVSFDLYLKWFVCIFSSLPVVAVFFVGSSVWKNRMSGLIAAAFYAVSIPSFERVIGHYLREEFALPFLFFSLYFFLGSIGHSQNRKAANAYGFFAGVFTFLALSSWHLSSFYFLVFLVGVAIVAFSRADLKPVMRPTLYVVGFAVLAGFLNEPLRTRLFLASFSAVIGYCLVVTYAASLRFRMDRRTAAGVLIPLIIVSLVLVALLSPNRGEYGHVYSLVFSKAQFLLDKPDDPGSLSRDARLLWLGPFQSPSLFSFLYGFGAIILASIYPLGVLLRRWVRRRATQSQEIILFMSLVFFLLFLFIRRLEIFAVFFIVVLIAGIYELLRGKGLFIALSLLSIIFAFEAFKATTHLRPSPITETLGRIKRPQVERPSIHDRDRTEIFRWIERFTRADAVFLARFAVSPMIVTYGQRTAVLHSIFETKHIREKVYECTSSFYRTEKELYDVCRKYGADHVLYEANQLLDNGELGDRYLTDNLKLMTDCAAFKLHFAPEGLHYFTPLFQTDYFRVFEVREKPGEQEAHYLRYSPQYDPSLFMVEEMGPSFSDSLVNVAWESIEKALGLVQQGTALAAEGGFSDAARMFNIALGLMPRLDRARLALAQCYRRIGRHDLAVAEYRKMIELDPLNVRVYIALAGNYREQNLLMRAVDVLQEGLELLPMDLNLQYRVAENYRDLGDTAEAVEYYERILEIDPSNGYARNEIERLRGIRDKFQ
ncbi:tetratricopeptide repeat protein [candidate division TA06 bacterium]|uniref:Tetratricopeptide repeat protein n=1 Tax=candidate division TA06 bacterium TaxID=2250710 RepID=A0A523XLW1_UNCT6|nr:MAG: tetratricopeptide repeat protein [candidate division TA06 bacterium]